MIEVLDKPSLEAVYLAHFGVRGMHWGQRKATSSGSEKKRKLTPEQKKRIVMLGAASVAATLYATGNLGRTVALTARGLGFVTGSIFTGLASATYVTADLLGAKPMERLANI